MDAWKAGWRKEHVMNTPLIVEVGRASRLIQTKITGNGDGTNAGFSRVQMTPSLEVAGPASDLIQAQMKGGGDGSNAGHSLIQCPPEIES
jgi:hypothetical protein